MKICILGSTGMLGSAVAKYFLNTEHDVLLTHRNKSVKINDDSLYFDALDYNFEMLKGCDYILNCIGIIKPFMAEDVLKSIQINSIFPRRLANFCKKNKINLIHITTDCVFSGKDGDYDENSLHDCLDDYGKSKSLGEPENCMVLRTSIIGEEIHKNASLVEWAKTMRGKAVRGFVNHRWNGLTTKEYAKVCQQIIENNLYKEEIFHVFSPSAVNKYELMIMLDRKYNLKMKVEKFECKEAVDRTLTSCKKEMEAVTVAFLQRQIEEM